MFVGMHSRVITFTLSHASFNYQISSTASGTSWKHSVSTLLTSKNNFWNVYKEMVDQWFLVYNSDLRFKEFCIGIKDQHDINDADIFTQFIKGIKDEN